MTWGPIRSQSHHIATRNRFWCQCSDCILIGILSILIVIIIQKSLPKKIKKANLKILKRPFSKQQFPTPIYFPSAGLTRAITQNVIRQNCQFIRTSQTPHSGPPHSDTLCMDELLIAQPIQYQNRQNIIVNALKLKFSLFIEITRITLF